MNKPIQLSQKTVCLILILCFGIGFSWLLSGQYVKANTSTSFQQAFSGSFNESFTYQGRLNQTDTPANGSYTFEFSLFDAVTNGNQVGSIQTETILVTEGLFTVLLNDTGQFGADAFTGEARYLQIRVSGDGGANYTTLIPRQSLTAIPYALYAKKVQPVANVVVVAESGGDYTSISAALDSITDATATNPYLIRVAPGIYNENVDLKAYVDIEGSGEGVTIIKGFGSNTDPNADSSSATLRVDGALSAEVRFLTVESDGSGKSFATGVWSQGVPINTFQLTHVTVNATGGSYHNNGVFSVYSSSPILNHVTVTTWGNRYNVSVFNSASASPILNNVIASATGASHTNVGIYNAYSSSPILNNVTSYASGNSRNFGMYNSASCLPVLENVTLTASGGTEVYGVYSNDNSAPTLNNVTVNVSDGVDTYGIFNITESVPTVSDSTITVANGTNNYGFYNVRSSFIVNNTVVVVTGGTVSYGVYNTAPSGNYFAKIDNSQVLGNSNSIRSDTEFRTYVGASKLAGGAVAANGGSFSCVGVYNSSYVALNNSCQ